MTLCPFPPYVIGNYHHKIALQHYKIYSSFPSAVQCERKPLVLTNGDFKRDANGDFKRDEYSNGDSGDEGSASESTSQSEERKLTPDSVKEAIGHSRGTENGTSENDDSQKNHEAGPIRPQVTHAFEAYNRGYVADSILAGVFPFAVDPPSIAVTEPGYLYELSTRMLFASVDWVKGLTCFSRLCEEDKIRLLVEKWYLLFALGLLQCSHMFPVCTLLTMAGTELSRSRSANSPSLRWQTFLKIKGVIMNGGMLGRVSKEIHEYMKIVTLFDQGQSPFFNP